MTSLVLMYSENLNMVWENLPAQLSKENKKFVYGVMREGARKRF